MSGRKRIVKLRNGEFDLGWMQAKSEWGVKATRASAA